MNVCNSASLKYPNTCRCRAIGSQGSDSHNAESITILYLDICQQLVQKFKFHVHWNYLRSISIQQQQMYKLQDDRTQMKACASIFSDEVKHKI